MKTYVLYHANCADGFGAALCAWLKFGDGAEYIPVSYGKPMPVMEEGSNVYILDFSYPREELHGLFRTMATQVVLDHHETARVQLADLPWAKFDLNKSGARMAWEYFFPGEPVPMLIRYIEDRDLWRWQLSDSREVSAALSLYPMEFALWNQLLSRCEDALEMMVMEGDAVLRLVRKNVEMQCKNAREFTLFHPETQWIEFKKKPCMISQSAYLVPVVNATCHVSEVGERLLELYPNAPFVGIYLDKADGSRMWSLRSRKDFDCSPIAKAFGGGGHKQACGFTLAAPGGQHEGGAA